MGKEATNLGQQAGQQSQRFWHVAPGSAAESIRTHGIDHRLGIKRWEIDYVAGNYLFGNENDAYEYREILAELAWADGGDIETFDVWAVNYTGPTVVDQFHDDETGLGENSCLVLGAIPADQISLVG